MKKTLLLCTAFAVLTTPAFAHVTANPDHGAAGNYFQTSLRIAHGCDGSGTTAVHVQFPPGLLSVHAQFKPGWKIKTVTRKLDKPVTGPHGKIFNEEVAEIVWSGGSLPDDNYDDFGLLLQLPKKPGETLWLPVIQECEKGREEWTQIPAGGQEWHALKNPAPFVRLEKADGGQAMPGQAMPGMEMPAPVSPATH